jgi:hypothetical protein
VPTLPENYIQTTSPFQDMASIQTSFSKSNNKDSLKDISQEIFTRTVPKSTVVKSTWSAPTALFKPEAVRIPPFKEYVSLRTNILADNESKLITMPYLGDEDEEGAQEALVRVLPFIYEIRHDVNALLDLRNEQCRFYKDTIETFLGEIGITLNMLLYWLLAPATDVDSINQSLHAHGNFRHLILDRAPYNTEVFRREEEITTELFVREDTKWQALLQQIQEPTAGQLRLTAVACAAIMTECEFSVWYMARQSKTMQDHILSKTKAPQGVPQFTFGSIVCRVCHE